MHRELRQAYDLEMTSAAEHGSGNNLDMAFYHLERAHILGQSFTVPHARAHWGMLKLGWKRRDPLEIRGQVARILGALIFSRIWVPVGNTGGAHVPPFASMPIPEDLKVLLNRRERI